jgi:hypothetical protein
MVWMSLSTPWPVPCRQVCSYEETTRIPCLPGSHATVVECVLIRRGRYLSNWVRYTAPLSVTADAQSDQSCPWRIPLTPGLPRPLFSGSLSLLFPCFFPFFHSALSGSICVLGHLSTPLKPSIPSLLSMPHIALALPGPSGGVRPFPASVAPRLLPLLPLLPPTHLLLTEYGVL